MPKRFFRRLVPHHDTIKNNKYLKIFSGLLHNPNLWHLNRQSVAGAFAVGLFVAFLPFPFQMVFAAGFAIVLHTNLPISVSLVWITNPLTMPALYFLAYKLGAWVLGTDLKDFQFELSWHWLSTGMLHIWQPFLLGCLLLGLILGGLGYITLSLLWRCLVIQQWRQRAKSRATRQP